MAGLLGIWRFNSVWEGSRSRWGAHFLIQVLSHHSSAFPCGLHARKKASELRWVAAATERLLLKVWHMSNTETPE